MDNNASPSTVSNGSHTPSRLTAAVSQFAAAVSAAQASYLQAVADISASHEAVTSNQHSESPISDESPGSASSLPAREAHLPIPLINVIEAVNPGVDDVERFWATLVDPYLVEDREQAIVFHPPSGKAIYLRDDPLVLQGSGTKRFRFHVDEQNVARRQFLGGTGATDRNFTNLVKIFREAEPRDFSLNHLHLNLSRTTWAAVLKTTDWPLHLWWDTRLARPLPCHDRRAAAILCFGAGLTPDDATAPTEFPRPRCDEAIRWENFLAQLGADMPKGRKRPPTHVSKAAKAAVPELAGLVIDPAQLVHLPAVICAPFLTRELTRTQLENLVCSKVPRPSVVYLTIDKLVRISVGLYRNAYELMSRRVIPLDALRRYGGLPQHVRTKAYLVGKALQRAQLVAPRERSYIEQCEQAAYDFVNGFL